MSAAERGLRDYFRLRPQQARPAIADLVEAGELFPVAVKGWARPAYLHRDARRPGGCRQGAAVAVRFARLRASRTEALFEFSLPARDLRAAPKRVHGYYVLPFLLGDRLVGRVDLKADRATGVCAYKPPTPRTTHRRKQPSSWRAS